MLGAQMPLALLNVEHLVSSAGYPLLFLIVMAESSGAPVPGETGLITAAVLASQGKLHIELVIPLAAAAAIAGDNIGYGIGRKGGRWILERPPWSKWRRGRGHGRCRGAARGLAVVPQRASADTSLSR